jgi:hypothetical protein
MTPWPFDDPPNVAVFTVQQIMDARRPILYVCHDEDDCGWQFLTGEPILMADALLVSLKNVVARDPSIAELADLPCGWIATRHSRDDAWRRERQGGDK